MVTRTESEAYGLPSEERVNFLKDFPQIPMPVSVRVKVVFKKS